MFERSRAFSVGEIYAQEILRLAQNPSLVDNVESAALLSQYDSQAVVFRAICQRRELDGESQVWAHRLSKSDAESMIDGEVGAVFIVGLRKRRYNDFMALLNERGELAFEIAKRRMRIAYQSREWGIWTVHIGKYLRLWTILVKLRVQAGVYRCGFEMDPTANLERLSTLLRRGKVSDFKVGK